MPTISTSGPHEVLIDTLAEISARILKANEIAEDQEFVMRQQLAHQTLADGEEGIQPEE